MKPVQIFYDKSMEPYFNEGRDQFCKETRIQLTGINWKVQGNSLVITITEEQAEKWFFHLAFTIGLTYATMKAKEVKTLNVS